MLNTREHEKWYLLNWNLNQLVRVCKVLDLNTDEDEIKRLIALFGGSAGYCHLQSEYISEGKNMIEAAIFRINIPDILKDFFNGNECKELTIHHLMRR
jgi:hypothetical protein